LLLGEIMGETQVVYHRLSQVMLVVYIQMIMHLPHSKMMEVLLLGDIVLQDEMVSIVWT